jgi:hypothetical protein
MSALYLIALADAFVSVLHGRTRDKHFWSPFQWIVQKILNLNINMPSTLSSTTHTYNSIKRNIKFDDEKYEFIESNYFF